MNLKDKKILVIGGSKGLGLGLVEALVEHAAKVTVVARQSDALNSLRDGLKVATIAADATDKASVQQILADLSPDVVILCAGTPPHMARLDEISWEDFSANWETDVKAGLYWIQAALNIPLAAESRLIIVSSGAAINGSPMSGGYGGAKRMQWFMASYANGVSVKKNLAIRFQVVVPRQMVLGTGTGDAGANAYARAANISPEEFVARFGKRMPPRDFGEKCVAILTDPQFSDGFAFGVQGDSGISILEKVTA